MNKFLMDLVEQREIKENIPAYRPGDTVLVHQRIFEGEKERVQLFIGTVIAFFIITGLYACGCEKL